MSHTLYMQWVEGSTINIYNTDNIIYHKILRPVDPWILDHLIERPDQEIWIKESDGSIEVKPYAGFK